MEKNKSDLMSFAEDELLDSAKADFDKKTEAGGTAKGKIVKIWAPVAASLAIVIAAGAAWKSGVFKKAEPVKAESHAPVTVISAEIGEAEAENAEISEVITETAAETDEPNNGTATFAEPETVIAEEVVEAYSQGFSSSDATGESSGNAPFIPAGAEGESTHGFDPTPMIDTPDAGCEAACFASPADGTCFFSPALLKTAENHAGEKVFYRLCLYVFSRNTPVTDEKALEAEAERLFNACLAKGLDNCVFEVSTYDDGQGGVTSTLYANITDTAFFDSFPASSVYGIGILLANE